MTGVWAGDGYSLNSNMDLSYFAFATVFVQDDANLTWSIPDFGDTGSYPIQDLTYGFYYGTNGQTEIVESFISADKSYVATYVNFGGPWPQDYQVWPMDKQP